MNESNSSSLDTLETNGDWAPPESYRKYCISKFPEEYQATVDAYEDFDLQEDTHRAYTLEECRTGAWFARNKNTGMVKVISSACHQRWCPMCSATRRWFLSQQVSEWLKTAEEPKFLTLTVKHTSNLLKDQIDFLYKSFRKYRKLDLLKRNVRGGVWFFQIHRAKSDGLWHPHLHCVIDSPWLDKYKLSTAWELVTKTSNIINIKQVKDTDSMSEYVARYAARPSLLNTLSVPCRLELLMSMHGRRLVGTWGCARSIVLRPSKPQDAEDWENVGQYRKVIYCLDSDERARKIWHAFKTGTECPENCNILEPEEQKPRVHTEDPQTVFDSDWFHLNPG